MRRSRSERCENARALISEELDTELPEINGMALRAHLRECAACTAFARELAEMTELLRVAPLEQPTPFALPAPKAHRALRHPVRLAMASATVLAASAAVGAFVGRTTQQVPHVFSRQAAQTSVAATQEPYVEQHLLAMLARSHTRTGRLVAT